MTYNKLAPTTARRIPRLLVAGLLIIAAAISVSIGYPLLMSSSSTAVSPTSLPSSPSQPQRMPQQALSEAPSPTRIPETEPSRPHPLPQQALGEARLPTSIPGSEPSQPQQPPRQALGEAPPPPGSPGRERRAALGLADGVVPDGTTIFDGEIPGIANLDPALLGALHQAATDAADEGIEFFVTSGWRSPEYQDQLLREAIATYGSEEEAAQWVATADTSPHVFGEAVDIGGLDARAWLSEHGARYGLCQIYTNEPWHYELRPEAIDRGCPPMYADPTHDPRMRQ